jgi:hypothetical protein
MSTNAPLTPSQVCDQVAALIDENNHDEAMARLAFYGDFRHAMQAFRANDGLIVQIGYAPEWVQEVRKAWTKGLAQHLYNEDRALYHAAKNRRLL